MTLASKTMVEMSYKGLEINTDKPALYNLLMIWMAELNADSDVTFCAFLFLSKTTHQVEQGLGVGRYYAIIPESSLSQRGSCSLPGAYA